MDFPYAERIAAASGVVVVLVDTLLARAGDIWRLMARSEQHAVVTLGIVRTRRAPGEGMLAFLWRSATAALQRHLYPQGPIGAFAVNKSLTTESGFREKIRHFGFLRSLYPTRPDILFADGYGVARTQAPVLLATGAATAEALRAWKNQKASPWWFSGKFFLFHVAQLAAYYGALVALLAPAASLVVFGFAVLITPGFFLRNLPWRRPHHALAQMAARVLLYFTG